MLINVREEKYAVVRAEMPDHDGYSMASPNVLLIGTGTTGDDLIDTHIHEFTHQFFPDLKERVVAQFATQLKDYLVAVGCHIKE